MLSVTTKRNKRRILLGQLGSYGDCLYATTIAYQIKIDYPDCHLTWAIGSMYRSILEANPHVDDIWEIPLSNHSNMENVWLDFQHEAFEKKKRGEFDEIYFTQIAPSNLDLYDGTIRSSIFRAYPYRITVPVTPVLKLTATEVTNVQHFVMLHGLSARKNIILFECSPKSAQSHVNPEFAIGIAQEIISKIPNTCFIFSSNISFAFDDKRLVDGSVLSFRENAELTKYCTMLIGCSSGISWICTTDWAKPLPMIQLIDQNAFWFASVVYDFIYFGLKTDNIIEMSNCSHERLIDCICITINLGFSNAHSKFHQHLQPSYNTFWHIFYKFVLDRDIKKCISFVKSNYQRNGIKIALSLKYLIKIVVIKILTLFKSANYIIF